MIHTVVAEIFNVYYFEVFFHCRSSSIGGCLCHSLILVLVTYISFRFRTICYVPLSYDILGLLSIHVYSCNMSLTVFYWRLSSIGGRLSLEVIFHCRSSSIRGRLPLKVVFHWRWSSIGGFFHWRSSLLEVFWWFGYIS
jgi:hypothetical protein